MARGERMKRLTDDERDEAEKHIPLVKFIVGKINKQPKRLDRDDQIQEGMFGVMRSVQLHDPAITKFSTYARHAITTNIIRADIDERLIHIPQYLFYDNGKGEKYREHVKSGPKLVRMDSVALDNQKSVARSDDDDDGSGDMIDALPAAMKSLSYDERYAIERLFYDDWSVLALSRHLKKSLHETKALKSIALQKLRAKLREAV